MMNIIITIEKHDCCYLQKTPGTSSESGSREFRLPGLSLDINLPIMVCEFNID